VSSMVETYNIKAMSTDEKRLFIKKKYPFHKKGLKSIIKKHKAKPSEEWIEEQATLRTIIDLDRARQKGVKPVSKRQWKYG